MKVEKVSLESIDFEDERFRISEDLDPGKLESSLREIGQLNPVHLLENDGSQRTIVCGFRRLRALKRVGHLCALAQIWQAGECDELHAFRLALWENLSHRELNALEIARTLSTLKNLCSVPQDTLVGVYLPLLGVPPHKNVLRRYLTLHALRPDLRRMFSDGRITLAGAERLSAMPAKTQDRMVLVLQNVRWSATLQREVLDLIEELAVIGDSTSEEFLNRPQIVTILDDQRLTPFQRGERIHDVLFRLRNPKLSDARERFLVQKEKLRLPGSIRVSSDPFFESSRVRVEFDAVSAEDFRRKAEALNWAAQADALEELFKVV